MDYTFDETHTESKIELIRKAFFRLSESPEVLSEFPNLGQFSDPLKASLNSKIEDDIEISFLNLYCELHRAGSTYSADERQILDDKKGYFNHPGGISPLLKAESFIKPDSIVADLGAGNGLQGLMFQCLYPHQKTIQIELSAEMIRLGKIFQKVLKIPETSIRWIQDDILNVSLDEIDFLYLYRPSKPIKSGIKLYEKISLDLNSRQRPLTIFSIADCLKDYLNTDYRIFYSDGHLTCFQKQ